MKKIIFFISASILFATIVQAQTGWYIIEKNTKYKVCQKSYSDYDSTGAYFDFNKLTISLVEVVFLCGQTDAYYMVSEISGRISFIDKKVKNTLTAIDKTGIVGYLNAAYTLADGHVMNVGSAIWITAVDEKLNTATALLYDGKVVNFSLTDILIVAEIMQKNMNIDNVLGFKTVK
jgi:hypothetical protein